VVNCKKKKIESIRDGIAVYHFCSGGDKDCFRHHGRIPLNEIARAAKADTLTWPNERERESIKSAAAAESEQNWKRR
jgi:hypothetical protein